MEEIKLVKKYPNIRDEDVTEIFQEGYLKGFENGRKNAIPIDKPFLKMRYGDYVVYNKKWLVDHLQTEWNILQGKEYQPSIPVEWIKKWCNKEHNRKSLEERLLKRYGVITMLEDWEKENETRRTESNQ